MASDDNDRAGEHFQRDLEQFEDDDYNGAIVEFNKSLRFDLNRFIALKSRGMCQTTKDEHDKAIHDFDEAFLLNPESQDIMDGRDDALSLRNRRLY